jgi:hypothetical protein
MNDLIKINDLDDALILNDLIVQICREEIEEALKLTELEINKLENGQTQVSNFIVWETSLKSVWFFYKALKYWVSEGNSQQAHENFINAREGFNNVGHKELGELTAGLEVYIEGLLDILNSNINLGLEKVKRVKEYFTRAGEFGSTYEKMLDHMKSDTFSLSAINAIHKKDFNSAQVLLEEASICANAVAEKYYNPDHQNYFFFKGLSKYYLGLYKCFWASNELSNFAFDTVILEKNLDKELIEACEFLANCDKSNKLQVNVWNIAQGLRELTGTMEEISFIMQNLTKKSFEYPREKFDFLQAKIQSSKIYFSKAGPESLSLLKFSDETSDKILNIKRLIKPSVADFGKHSGIITCIIFLPTSFSLMWANKYFTFGLDSWGLLGIGFLVSLVGGFGYGALKFKDLILALFKQGG